MGSSLRERGSSVRGHLWVDAIASDQEKVALPRGQICLKHVRGKTPGMSKVSSSQ